MVAAAAAILTTASPAKAGFIIDGKINAIEGWTQFASPRGIQLGVSEQLERAPGEKNNARTVALAV